MVANKFSFENHLMSIGPLRILAQAKGEVFLTKFENQNLPSYVSEKSPNYDPRETFSLPYHRKFILEELKPLIRFVTSFISADPNIPPEHKVPKEFFFAALAKLKPLIQVPVPLSPQRSRYMAAKILITSLFENHGMLNPQLTHLNHTLLKQTEKAPIQSQITPEKYYNFDHFKLYTVVLLIGGLSRNYSLSYSPGSANNFMKQGTVKISGVSRRKLSSYPKNIQILENFETVSSENSKQIA
ncbi:hypothetical protein RF11_02271 [Thelohanellus kitauei]|uniref:Uncharacterized protein n=1 Tax=Thelohanellus kitauei TaxID=669202 RepID=A0A0C2MP72_THEKT|nr:hypothetical protein RF11_02271 [Thelohanellus kitauei]